MKMWNDQVLKHILLSVGRLIKWIINQKRFLRPFLLECVEVDLSKPLKRKIKYTREALLYEYLLDCRTLLQSIWLC